MLFKKRCGRTFSAIVKTNANGNRRQFDRNQGDFFADYSTLGGNESRPQIEAVVFPSGCLVLSQRLFVCLFLFVKFYFAE